jgi:hypothetical protein
MTVCTWPQNSESSSPIALKFWDNVAFEYARVYIYEYIRHLYLARKGWSLKQSPKVLHRMLWNFDTMLHSNTRVFIYIYIYIYDIYIWRGSGGAYNSLWKFFTDCFQILTQRRIRIHAFLYTEWDWATATRGRVQLVHNILTPFTTIYTKVMAPNLSVQKTLTLGIRKP